MISRVVGAFIIAALLGWGIHTFFSKKKEERVITYSTSDARNLKGEYTIALDSWIGYFLLQSPIFGNLMRDDGYRLKIIDDRADYPGRMKMLRKGEIHFAVCTVDSYLLNGRAVGYPGIITAIIDESKGGDAVIAWKERLGNVEFLKTKKDYKIAFTPASPSEHLLKSLKVHFDIGGLLDKEHRVEVEGAEEAYKKLMARKVDAAVLWEPHVTEALSHPGIVKLIGSEDMEKLIVDILLVNRRFAEKNPEMVKIFLKNYFETLRLYQASPEKLSADIEKHQGLSARQVKSMLSGVRWINYAGNMRWFGLAARDTHRNPEIVDSLQSTIGILKNNGDLKANPLPDGDPYTIINSVFLKGLSQSVTPAGEGGHTDEGDSLTRRFSRLDDDGWGRLSVIGSLKLRPISFRSGTEELDDNGREEVRQLVESVRHYPNFRIMVKGHTGLRGDPAANRALSVKRAGAVRDELVHGFRIDPNRIRILGMGASEPLPKEDSESDASYNSRLKRVEILFLSGK